LEGRNLRADKSPIKVLLVTTISHVMQHIYVGSSVLLPLIVADLKLNYTEFGLAMAVSSLIGGLSQIFFSVASRKIARHILLGLGNILLSLGTFLTGLSQKLIHFLSARLISNIGVAPQHPMGTAILSEKFDDESIGKAVGFHYGLAYIGNIAGPAIMTLLAATLGWRPTLFIFSVPALAVGLIVIWYLGGFSQCKADLKASGGDAASLKSDAVALIKNRSIAVILAVQSLMSGGTDIGILTTYIPLFLADSLGMDIYARGVLYTIGLLGGVVGPILLGSYAGKAGYVRTSVFSAFSASILAYLLASYGAEVNSYLLAFHLFILMFTGFSLTTLLQSQLVRATQGYNRDLAVGAFFTAGFIFNSLWTGIIGYLLDSFSSFKPVFLLMGTLEMAASIVLMSQIGGER